MAGVHESTILLTSQSVSWLVFRPFATKLTLLYATSVVKERILFFSLFN